MSIQLTSEAIAEPPRATNQQLAQASSGTQLITRGDEFIAIKDVSSARLFYEMAATAGSAEAAAKLGMSYDTLYLEELGVVGDFADTASAIKWYRQAVNQGFVGVKARLDALEAQTQPSRAQPPARPDDSQSAAALILNYPGKTGAETREASQAELLPVEQRLDAAVEPVQSAAATSGPKIQLAAMGSKEAALEEAVALKIRHWDLLANRKLLVERLELTGGRGVMYGVQVGPFEDQTFAGEFCTKLKAEGQNCFVVP